VVDFPPAVVDFPPAVVDFSASSGRFYFCQQHHF